MPQRFPTNQRSYHDAMMSVSPPRGDRSQYNYPDRLHLSSKCSSRDALSHKQLTSCPLLDTFSRLQVTWMTVATTLHVNISILCSFSNNCWVPAVEFISQNDGFVLLVGCTWRWWELSRHQRNLAQRQLTLSKFKWSAAA